MPPQRFYPILSALFYPAASGSTDRDHGGHVEEEKSQRSSKGMHCASQGLSLRICVCFVAYVVYSSIIHRLSYLSCRHGKIAGPNSQIRGSITSRIRIPMKRKA